MLQIWGPHLENHCPSSFPAHPKVGSPAPSLEQGLLLGFHSITALQIPGAVGPSFPGGSMGWE